MRALHVVESLKPQAGSIGVLLRDTLAAIEPAVESETISADGSHGDASAGTPGTSDLDAFDAVHIHGWGYPLAHEFATRARKSGKPYMITPLGSLGESLHRKRSLKDKLRWTFGEKALVRSACMLNALNEPESKAFAKLGVWDAGRDHAGSPYGVRFADYADSIGDSIELPDPLEGRCLLVLGPIHPIEGCVVLLKAFAELGRHAEGWHIVFAGPQVGEYRDMLEAAVRRKGGVDRVMFATAPDVPTQRAWLARADVLVAPSLHVRPPVSILQAVAAGVPAVASDLVAPGSLSSAVRVYSPKCQALHDALRSMLTCSDSERTSMVEKARTLGQQHHDAGDSAALTSVYETLYKNARR